MMEAARYYHGCLRLILLLPLLSSSPPLPLLPPLPPLPLPLPLLLPLALHGVTHELRGPACCSCGMAAAGGAIGRL